MLLDKRNLYLFMLRQLEMETIGSDMFKETVLMLLTE